MARLIDRLRAAGFDLDGTLIDTAPDLGAAANATLAELGLTLLPEARFPRLVGGGIAILVERALTESLGHPPEPALRGKALERFRENYAARLFERSRVYPGVIEGLGRLREAGLALCCITNKHSRFALPLLEAAGLASLFDFTLCADEPARRKPEPAMLLDACARFGIAPARMLYVGDSRTDVLAARAAGCPVAAVDYGYDAELGNGEPQPDAFITSLAVIAELGADPAADAARIRALQR